MFWVFDDSRWFVSWSIHGCGLMVGVVCGVLCVACMVCCASMVLGRGAHASHKLLGNTIRATRFHRRLVNTTQQQAPL